MNEILDERIRQIYHVVNHAHSHIPTSQPQLKTKLAEIMATIEEDKLTMSDILSFTVRNLRLWFNAINAATPYIQSADAKGNHAECLNFIWRTLECMAHRKMREAVTTLPTSSPP